MRTDYVVFWANDHHPVRILPIRMRELDHELGSPTARRMNAYCKHLESVFPGTRIMWEPTDDCKASYPALLARDLAEYDAWLQDAVATA
jgi:hypothetical protein